MAMTAVDELRGRLRRRWDRGEFLGDTAPIGDDAAFPIRVPTGVPAARVIRDDFDAVHEWASSYRTLDPTVEWTVRRDRTVGEVRLPAAVVFEDIDNLARFLGRETVAELKQFREIAGAIVDEIPELREWIGRSPRRVVSVADEIASLIAVTRWYRDHPRSGAYLRQIPVPGIDTKFVERHRGLLSRWWEIVAGAGTGIESAAARGATTPVSPPHDPNNRSGASGSAGFAERFGFRAAPRLVRFSVLDPDRSIAGYRDVSVPIDEFAATRPPGVERVFVVENDVTALAFPEVPGAIVVFGRGFSVGEVAAVGWLAEVDVVYAGDLDTHGFAILNRLRTHVPGVRSILMDSKTLLSHRDQWSREQSQTTVDLPTLTPSEREVYDALRYNRFGEGVRLEQERISYDRVVAAVMGIQE